MAAVAQIPRQHDVHPLLRHPRPITRDFAKAQRMLGLIADSEEKLTGLHREKSKTTKWLERPLYAHLDVSDAESEKDEDYKVQRSEKTAEKSNYEKVVDLLEQSAKPHRPTSFSSEDAVQTLMEPKTKLDTQFNKRRPEPLINLRPISQHLLSPEWTVSPSTLSPNVQSQRPLPMQPNNLNAQRGSFSSTSSSDSIPRFVHQQTWPAVLPQQTNGRQERPVSYQPLSSMSEGDDYTSLGSPQHYEQRPRPTSFATFQQRDRRNSKIASSRGLRNNSYPNFSRPISEIALKAVPGERLEGDAVYDNCDDYNIDSSSPSLPVCAAPNEPELGTSKSKDEKKPKNRWSTIKTLKNFAIKRSSAAAPEQIPKTTIDDISEMNLTEENLTWHENEVSHAAVPSTPKNLTPGVKLLPTPTYSPLEFKHPLFEAALPPPFAPWADGPPSPASSQEKRRGSDLSLSPTRKRTQSRLSVENIVHSRPDSLHSRHSSLGLPSPSRYVPPPQMTMDGPASPRPVSRRGTPSLERTCIICKTTKQPTAFVNRHIAGNCWHEPATCYQCLQSHIEKCVTTQGWDHCTCPECGEHMTHDDLGAFADDENTLVRWED
jgi:hypothetical protein